MNLSHRAAIASSGFSPLWLGSSLVEWWYPLSGIDADTSSTAAVPAQAVRRWRGVKGANMDQPVALNQPTMELFAGMPSLNLNENAALDQHMTSELASHDSEALVFTTSGVTATEFLLSTSGSIKIRVTIINVDFIDSGNTVRYSVAHGGANVAIVARTGSNGRVICSLGGTTSGSWATGTWASATLGDTTGSGSVIKVAERVAINAPTDVQMDSTLTHLKLKYGIA